MTNTKPRPSNSLGSALFNLALAVNQGTRMAHESAQEKLLSGPEVLCVLCEEVWDDCETVKCGCGNEAGSVCGRCRRFIAKGAEEPRRCAECATVTEEN